jgi:hypothetical protein
MIKMDDQGASDKESDAASIDASPTAHKSSRPVPVLAVSVHDQPPGATSVESWALAGRHGLCHAAAMARLRVGTWNIAGARREPTNQVDLDAVMAGIRALGSSCWPSRRSTGTWPAAAAATSRP